MRPTHIIFVCYQKRSCLKNKFIAGLVSMAAHPTGRMRNSIFFDSTPQLRLYIKHDIGFIAAFFCLSIIQVSVERKQIEPDLSKLHAQAKTS